MIFSWPLKGRSAIFGREIGVPDREIFSQQKKKINFSQISVKNCDLQHRRSLRNVLFASVWSTGGK